MGELISIGDPAFPPPAPEDLQPVRLLRRWSSTPPPHSEILQLWHFWPDLRRQTLADCLAAVRESPAYVLGTFERRQARWWQIMAEQSGLQLHIEHL